MQKKTVHGLGCSRSVTLCRVWGTFIHQNEAFGEHNSIKKFVSSKVSWLTRGVALTTRDNRNSEIDFWTFLSIFGFYGIKLVKINIFRHYDRTQIGPEVPFSDSWNLTFWSLFHNSPFCLLDGGIASGSSENTEEEIKYQWSSKFFPKKYVILGGQTIEIWKNP